VPAWLGTGPVGAGGGTRQHPGHRLQPILSSIQPLTGCTWQVVVADVSAAGTPCWCATNRGTQSCGIKGRALPDHRGPSQHSWRRRLLQLLLLLLLLYWLMGCHTTADELLLLLLLKHIHWECLVRGQRRWHQQLLWLAWEVDLAAHTLLLHLLLSLLQLRGVLAVGVVLHTSLVRCTVRARVCCSCCSCCCCCG
jgi:hypothetical protein